MHPCDTGRDQRGLPQDFFHVHVSYTGTGVPRRILVKGSGNVPATVVVTARQGRVWMSVIPPFTWDAIMEPEKIDELMHVLRLTQEEARTMTFVGGRWMTHADKGSVQEITSGKD